MATRKHPKISIYKKLKKQGLNDEVLEMVADLVLVTSRRYPKFKPPKDLVQKLVISKKGK